MEYVLRTCTRYVRVWRQISTALCVQYLYYIILFLCLLIFETTFVFIVSPLMGANILNGAQHGRTKVHLSTQILYRKFLLEINANQSILRRRSNQNLYREVSDEAAMSRWYQTMNNCRYIPRTAKISPFIATSILFSDLLFNNKLDFVNRLFV